MKIDPSIGNLVPRITQDAIDELAGRSAGLYDSEVGNQEKYLETYVDGAAPYEDVYGHIEGWAQLRTIYYIDTEREREAGVGEDWPHEPLPFNKCLVREGWGHNGETQLF